MTASIEWTATFATIALIALYQVFSRRAARHPSGTSSRGAHAALRDDWFEAISSVPGSELLAVQTLRNSLMSATLTASAAALALMGSTTMAVAAITSDTQISPRSILILALMAQLFLALASSAMAVRYFNHAGYICGMPVAASARARWLPLGTAYLRHGGDLYGSGLRYLVLIAPILAAIVIPLAGPIAAGIVIGSLWRMDQIRNPA